MLFEGPVDQRCACQAFVESQPAVPGNLHGQGGIDLFYGFPERFIGQQFLFLALEIDFRQHLVPEDYFFDGFGDSGCFAAAAGAYDQQQGCLWNRRIGDIFLAHVSPVDLFEQGLQLHGNMYIPQSVIQERKQIKVVLGRDLFFQNAVPGVLGVGLARNFEAFLPVRQNLRIFKNIETFFGRLHDERQ